MASVSIRKTIVLAVINQLKTITTPTYNTALANNVVDWQLSNVSLDDLPGIEVRDLSEESEIRGQYHYNTLEIEVVGRIGTADIDVARDLQEDMTKAMAAMSTMPSSVYQFEPAEKPELLPEKEKKTAVRITMTYQVKYREKIL